MCFRGFFISFCLTFEEHIEDLKKRSCEKNNYLHFNFSFIYSKLSE